MNNNFKKNMKEKIKQFSKESYLDGYIENEFLTKDGDADIFIKISEKNELLDFRTIGRQQDLENGIYEYLEEKSSMLNNDVKINFHIEGLKLDTKEQEEIRHIFKEHYAIELYKVQKEYNRTLTKVIGLFMVGFIILFIYLGLYHLIDDVFVFEILSFVFSFSLWEAFDIWIFSISEIKKNREEICQNLLTDISFEENSKIE